MSAIPSARYDNLRDIASRLDYLNAMISQKQLEDLEAAKMLEGKSPSAEFLSD
jgi:hypothetical protein